MTYLSNQKTSAYLCEPHFLEAVVKERYFQTLGETEALPDEDLDLKQRQPPPH